MSIQSTGARSSPGTRSLAIHPWAFYALAFASFGRPLAVAISAVGELIVFAIYPLFAAKQWWRLLPAWVLSAAASGLAIYGLVTALQQSSS